MKRRLLFVALILVASCFSSSCGGNPPPKGVPVPPDPLAVFRDLLPAVCSPAVSDPEIFAIRLAIICEGYLHDIPRLTQCIALECGIITATPAPPIPRPSPSSPPTPAPSPTLQPAATSTAPPPTPAPVIGQCPSTAPAVKWVNGSNGPAPYVNVPAGAIGVDMTWWYDCDALYRVGAVYRKVGEPNTWVQDGTPPSSAACWQGDVVSGGVVLQHFTYPIGDVRKVCATGGATACDPGHQNNPGMSFCCRAHEWKEDQRRGVVTAVDDLGTVLTVDRGIGGNPAFSAIYLAHPGHAITVNYCLPSPPLVDAECGTVFPSPADGGCSHKTFIP